jgi:hypothetical protein
VTLKLADLPGWPALLDFAEACAFLRLSEGTFRKVCDVAPLDLGVNVLRYRTAELDAWQKARPHRQLRPAPEAAQDAPAPEPAPANDRPSVALDRVRRRLGGAV